MLRFIHLPKWSTALRAARNNATTNVPIWCRNIWMSSKLLLSAKQYGDQRVSLLPGRFNYSSFMLEWYSSLYYSRIGNTSSEQLIVLISICPSFENLYVDRTLHIYFWYKSNCHLTTSMKKPRYKILGRSQIHLLLHRSSTHTTLEWSLENCRLKLTITKPR